MTLPETVSGALSKANLVRVPDGSRKALSDTQTPLQVFEEITNQAQGVFLWVYLVVRQLKEGLTNFNSVRDLGKRLENMPS